MAGTSGRRARGYRRSFSCAKRWVGEISFRPLAINRPRVLCPGLFCIYTDGVGGVRHSKWDRHPNSRSGTACGNASDPYLFMSMREFPSSLGLSGSMLIAHPNLLDPNFRRSVLIISTNDPHEGSFGLVLNRASEKTVGELLPTHELGLLAELPVFLGGPVARDQLTFAAFNWVKGALRIKTHLLLDEARDLAADGEGSVRAFLGYAGWSKGQLEAELEQKAWLVQRPDEEILDIDKCMDMWPTIMREQGPWFRLLAAAPDDPTLN